jgi:hypothetical protein
MRFALLSRLKRRENVRAVEQSYRPFKIEFASLKLLPREYSGPRHRVKVGQRPDGDEYEERSGEPPPDHVEDQDPNVMRLYLVSAHDAADEIDCATDLLC